jgi:hypothetical protein
MTTWAYTKDLKYYGRTKHINIRYNFITNTMRQKKMTLQHIFTSHMEANTKPIPRDVFKDHVRKSRLHRL